MKNIIYFLLFAICEFAISQPIVTYHSDHSIGTTADLYLLGGDITAFNQTGAGITWNVTPSTTLTKAGTYESVSPQSTPYSANFPTANLAYKRTITGMGTTYTYLVDSPAELGSVGDEIGGTNSVVWLQKNKLLQYPFSFMESFSATRQTSTGQPEQFTRVYDSYGTLNINNKVYTNIVRVNNPNGNVLWLTTSPVIFPVVMQVSSGGTLVYIEPNNLSDVETVSIQSPFSCVPNPTTDYITVTLSDTHINRGAELLLVNNLGQVVLQSTLSAQSEMINLNGLPSGIYMCVVRNNVGFMHQQKLLVR